MGEVEIVRQQHVIIIHSDLFFYGNAATESLSEQVAANISVQWNEHGHTVSLKGQSFKVHFNIRGFWAPRLTAIDVLANVNPRNNYFRIEPYSHGNISYVDDIGCNTGYFLLDNIINDSTTAAHEYGHTLGLVHPDVLDIRGKGVPGIMYPRGTITDPAFQYSPLAQPLAPGGTMNPFFRKVLPPDIEALKLHRLQYNENGMAMIGDFSSVWHEAEVKY